jgi:ABC-2 type transport system ATP-binding protein
MESVEELCDHIALIHLSNKVLEGNLLEIKRSFKSNTFEVGIETNQAEALKQLLITQNYVLHEADFKTIHNDYKLLVQLQQHTANDLLQLLIANGQVTHFLEKIPSANDIFIQTVSKKS